MAKTDTSTFHLGITMAGAVSAGAYTAGFMDYLLEALECWEAKKAHNRQVGKEGEGYDLTVPMHNVVIDVLGGASAGGMVGMITALSTYANMPPVHKPSDTPTGNILYDSWVLLDDDVETSRPNPEMTFEKMLRTQDISADGEGVKSLLNSRPIDAIADRVFDQLVSPEKKRSRPPYISEDLHVLMTLCSIRGVPFEVKFNTFSSAKFPYSPGHRMHEHMVVAHFKWQYNAARDQDVYLKFDPYDPETAELMKLCTKATGAFPIGLQMRQFQGKLSKEYVKNSILRNLDIQDPTAVEIYIGDDFFDFTDVDGGTINNEPYSQVVRILEGRHAPYDPKHPLFGTLMIDPFPNFYNQDEAKPLEEETDSMFQRSIWQVLGRAYPMFQQQVRVKREGVLYKDYFRMLVFPLKRKSNGDLEDHPPLASSLLGGFGGFLDREFRKHDFFLGRDNARNFLRGLFMLEYDAADPHPLFKGIPLEAIEAYARTPRENNPERKRYLPIIPDVAFPGDKERGETNPFAYTMPHFPQLQKGYLEKVEPLVKKRIKALLRQSIQEQLQGKWWLRTLAKLFRGLLAKRATQFVMGKIAADLQKREMMP